MHIPTSDELKQKLLDKNSKDVDITESGDNPLHACREIGWRIRLHIENTCESFGRI